MIFPRHQELVAKRLCLAKRCAPRNHAAARERGEAGFTLLEVMVAVAILAVLAGLVPKSFVFARSIIDHSRDWMGARLVAESVLNSELSSDSLQPGARTGIVDGRRWRATLRRYTPPGAPASGDGEALLDVRLDVDVSAGRTFSVETIRMGSASQ